MFFQCSVILFRPVRRYGQFHPSILSTTSPSRHWPSSYKPMRHINGYGGPPVPGQIGPSNADTEEISKPGKVEQPPKWSPTLFKMFESAATTIVSLMVLG
jgi:hypothetical protein